MRKFVINVNGNQYEVEVEEVGGVVQPSAPVVSAAAPAPAAAPAAPATPAPAAPAPAPVSSGAVGAIKVNCPMPGTIIDLKVNAGDSIKSGDILLILEAMKMENEILAPGDGTVATVNVSKGASVNSGDLLVSINE
ncbi:MAG TPA: biotin/lipoyl-containing protein [Thermoclostridium sp.]|nr:biotin/lipoyl-containing protein [Thermoclostridium sp.]